MEITTLIIIPKGPRPDNIRGKWLRKAICNAFPDAPILHGHGNQGYPRISYRVVKGMPHIVGIGPEGRSAIEVLEQAFPSILPYEGGTLQVAKVTVAHRAAGGSIGDHKTYHSITPILLTDKKEKLEKYLNSQIPSATLAVFLKNNLAWIHKELKGEEAVIDVINVRLSPIKVKKKGIDMIGFRGSFVSNMDLTGLAVGRGTSMGFGVVDGGVSHE